jgi:hypothetical protein
MEAIINKERLKIYLTYNGDIDWIFRLRRKDDEKKFGNNLSVIWREIDNKMQDLKIIENNLASRSYKAKTINELRVLTNNETFDELTIKLDLSKETNLIDIIKAYQEGADKAVKIFKSKFKIDNILEGCRHYKLYPQVGQLIDEGIYRYAFHGAGLCVYFKDMMIDFDFEECPELRHDGFELWKLKQFITNQKNKYKDYQDEQKVEDEFNELIKQEIIVKAQTKYNSSIYFFRYYLLLNRDI